MTDQENATVREWTDLLARIRFGTIKVAGKNITSSRIKLVASRMANYADSDGSRVRPGIARLAVDLETTYDTASRAVQHLARLGLLTLVRAGARPGHADEYRLAIPADLLDRVEVLTPAQHLLEMEKVREENRGKYKKPKSQVDPEPSDLHLPEGPADADTCTSLRDPQITDLHLPQGPADTPTVDTPAPPAGTADNRPAPPAGSDLHLPQGGATDHGPRHNYDLPTNGDLRTDLTGPRADRPEDPDSDVVGEEPEPGPLRLVAGNPDATATTAPRGIWPALVADDEPEPAAVPAEGHGFCVPCHTAGQYVLAADPDNGSQCAYHLRSA